MRKQKYALVEAFQVLRESLLVQLRVLLDQYFLHLLCAAVTKQSTCIFKVRFSSETFQAHVNFTIAICFILVKYYRSLYLLLSQKLPFVAYYSETDHGFFLAIQAVPPKNFLPLAKTTLLQNLL